MQGIGSIVDCQVIHFSLNYKLTLSNTVSNSPYHSSKVARISEITYKCRRFNIFILLLCSLYFQQVRASYAASNDE